MDRKVGPRGTNADREKFENVDLGGSWIPGVPWNLNISDLALISLTRFQMFFCKFFTESRIKNIDFAIDFIKQYILIGQF